MVKEHQFDTIVSGFYKASTGAIGWDEALTPVHEAFGTRATVMQSVDLERGNIVQLAHGGPPTQAAIWDYFRHWHALDPRRDLLLANPEQMIDRWWHCHEHFDERFAGRDRFYSHFLSAHQSRYVSTTATMVTPTLLTSFGLELPSERGTLTVEERSVLERLGRHVADALRAYERVRRMAAQALAGHALLDAFSYPMWLLDAERFVFYANPAAIALQAMGEAMDTPSRRLVWRASRTDSRLGVVLHELGQGRHGVRATVDARQRASDPPSWLHLQALVPGRVLGAFGDRPLVLATLFDPSFMTKIDPFALGDLFNMTPTEGRVAALLAEGLTAGDIAQRLGSTVSTVRTHLRRVMSKLGAKRLADAVRLLREGNALWAMPTETMSRPFADR